MVILDGQLEREEATQGAIALGANQAADSSKADAHEKHRRERDLVREGSGAADQGFKNLL